MKCENCSHDEMLRVDDGRFENGSGFDSYMCPVCLTECYIELLSNKMVTKNWSFRQQYLIRNEDLVRETYRNFQTVKNGGTIDAG